MFVQLAGGSFGFQIGGQSTDLVLVAMNDQWPAGHAEEQGEAGRRCGCFGGTGWAQCTGWYGLEAECGVPDVLAEQGIVCGLDLDGTVLNQNSEDTRTFYGTNIPFETVLKGNQPVPEAAKPFVRTVAKYFVSSKAAQ